MEESLKTPGEFLISDFAKFDRPLQLHVGFQALDEFQKIHKELPHPRNEKDAAEVFGHAQSIKEREKIEADLDEKIIKLLSYNARGDISPMAAIFGGIVAQEVMKACSGKFHPIHQWFYFDAVETLPENLTEEDCKIVKKQFFFLSVISLFFDVAFCMSKTRLTFFHDHRRDLDMMDKLPSLENNSIRKLQIKGNSWLDLEPLVAKC